MKLILAIGADIEILLLLYFYIVIMRPRFEIPNPPEMSAYAVLWVLMAIIVVITALVCFISDLRHQNDFSGALFIGLANIMFLVSIQTTLMASLVLIFGSAYCWHDYRSRNEYIY